MKDFLSTRHIFPTLLRLFNLRPDEAPLVGLMLLYSLLMGIPGIVTETTGYSLFLERFSAQDIPYIYIGFAIVTSILGFIFTRVEPKLPQPTLFFSLLMLLAVPLLIFRVLHDLLFLGILSDR